MWNNGSMLDIWYDEVSTDKNEIKEKLNGAKNVLVLYGGYYKINDCLLDELRENINKYKMDKVYFNARTLQADLVSFNEEYMNEDGKIDWDKSDKDTKNQFAYQELVGNKEYTINVYNGYNSFDWKRVEKEIEDGIITFNIDEEVLGCYEGIIEINTIEELDEYLGSKRKRR